MVTRDLRFNIFANDRASAAFARVSAAADAVSARLASLDGRRVRARVEADTSGLEAKLAQAEAHLAELHRKKASPKIDADIATAQAKMVRLASELQQLNNKRTQAKIDADTSAARQELNRLLDRLTELGRRTPSPKVALETHQVRAQIANVRKLLADLDQERADPEIGLRTAEIEAQMQRLRAHISDLNRQKASPKVDADIAVAEAKIAQLRRQIDDLRENGATVRIGARVDGRAINSLLGRLNDLRAAFQNNINAVAVFSRNLRQLGTPISLASMIPTLASIGAAIETAAGAMLAMPAAAGAAAAAVGTLAIGFHGLLDAIGPRDTGTQIKNADRELARLGESAQKLAHVVIGLKDDWNTLKQTVQDSLFRNIAPIFQNLADQWIPLLTTGLSGMAAEFNALGGQMAFFLGQASTMNDVSAMFDMFGMTLHELTPAFANLGEAFLDLATVGASFLPELAAGFTDLTARFEHFVDTARADGSLQLWVAQGIAQLQLMGQVLVNIGGIFKAVLDAARASGDSFVESLAVLTAGIRDFLASSEGQLGLISLFQGIRDAVDSLLPGLKAIGTAAAESFAVLQPAVGGVGTAFSDLAAAIAPTIVVLSQMAVDVAIPLAAAMSALSNALGPVIPMVLALSVAFRALTGVGTIFLTAGAAVKGFAERMGMASLAMGASGQAAQRMTDSTTRMGNVLTRVGNSLPLIGTAVLALVAAYDQLRSKASELANQVIQGSTSMQAAVDEEVRRFQLRNSVMDESTQEGYAMGEAIGVVTGQLTEEEIAQRNSAEAARERAQAQTAVSNEIARQLGQMDPLARATAEVTILESNYNDQLRLHGANSQEASVAADLLKAAKDRLAAATHNNTTATQTNTEALIANSNAVMAAANADVALQQANLNVERQTARTTEVLKEHSASSIEGRQATLDLQNAYIQAAAAAGRKAQADAEAKGASDAAAQGARAYQERLIELAAQATGPTREALLTLIANFDTTRTGANDAALAAVGLKDDIAEIPTEHSTTFNQPGMPESRENVRGLKGEVDSLTDKSFTIKATGEVVGRNMLGRASGGVLPGWTPGRDVHEFYSPTGGGLALSGGEAIMRPEWTAAVGVGYVNRANQIARTGGVPGVRSFMSGDTPGFANGGVIQRFAAGGTVSSPTSFTWTGQTITEWYESAVQSIIEWAKGIVMAAIRALMSAITGALNIGGDVVSAVQGAAAAFGWAAGNQWNSLVRLIQKESSWNPNAANPTSSARGLFQKMTSIHGPVEGSAAGQAAWGLNYIAGRYGSPAAALAFHNRNGWYDRGGLAMGTGFMAKMTNRPERVLSPEQTVSFERLVQLLGETRTVPVPVASERASDRAAQEVQALRSEMAALGETIRSSLAVTRPITVEDRSGNPVETGRAISLAMRL